MSQSTSRVEATTCVYCRGRHAAQFPREHVIPEAFGRFKNNLTLRCVCGNCNAYFGRELELILARDSGEALLRLKYGLKSPTESAKLKKKRIQLSVAVRGPWLGARIVLKPNKEETGIEAELIPQVGFRKMSRGDWVWISEEELHASVVAPFRKDSEIKIVGPSAESSERVKGRLGELGISSRQEGTLDKPITSTGTIEAELQYTIDQVIFRGMGKIAFNYLAWVHGSDFVLKSDFDPIRRYIRHGSDPGWRAVQASTMPVLADDTPVWRQTNGHLLVLDWNRSGVGLVSYVTLFNSITYHVRLCRRYSGLWQYVRSGHHFDIETKTISEVIATSLVRPGRPGR